MLSKILNFKKNIMSNHQLAFLLARITLGINLFLHGFVRIPKLEMFANGLTQGFEGTMLPLALVAVVAYAIPFKQLSFFDNNMA